MAWKLDIDWSSVDWNKRDCIIAKELGCSIHVVWIHRRKETTIRHKTTGRMKEPLPIGFTPLYKKGKISNGLTKKHYGVGQKLAQRWIEEWSNNQKLS